MTYQFVYQPILNDNRRLYLSQVIYNANANYVTFIFCIANTISQLLADEKYKFVMLLDERYKMSFKEYKEYEKLLNL